MKATVAAACVRRFLSAVALCCALAHCQDRYFWYEQAKGQLGRRLQAEPPYGVARNLILVIGDGMGLSTVTAARILRGQKDGHPGEETQLAFERFPYVALAKTYNVDSQVGDSAACATALMCGVKGRLETLGLDDRGHFDQCSSSFESRVTCLMEWAQQEGKATALVTTTRVSHATPAALYAHVPSRYWEDDSKMPEDAKHACKDIVRQLIEDEPGRNINVILGGGRRHFLPAAAPATASSGKGAQMPPELGKRKDGRHMVDEWVLDKKKRHLAHKYVSTAEDLMAVDTDKVDYLLGLFASSHLDFESERDRSQPTLADMTRKAIEIVRKNPHGYFLMVEGGRIDHAHHYSNAHRALHETLSLEAAVSAAVASSSPDETLVVVTADHSHVFSIGGLARRGNPIFGVDTKLSDVDHLPYTTLLYANGPGYDHGQAGGRANLTGVDTADKDYVQQSAVPRRWETHGAEDVPVYAQGPMAHLFQGVIEQSFVPHAMALAGCIGHFKEQCALRRPRSQNHPQRPLCDAILSGATSALPALLSVLLPVVASSWFLRS